MCETFVNGPAWNTRRAALWLGSDTSWARDAEPPRISWRRMSVPHVAPPSGDTSLHICPSGAEPDAALVQTRTALLPTNAACGDVGESGVFASSTRTGAVQVTPLSFELVA